MRIQNWLLWMIIPLLFACNMKGGSSRPASSEELEVEAQALDGVSYSVDSANYSSTIAGDSVVEVISTCETNNSKHSHTDTVAAMDSKNHPNVNYSNTSFILADEEPSITEKMDSFDIGQCEENVSDPVPALDTIPNSIYSKLPSTELASDSLLVNFTPSDNRIKEKVESYTTRRGMIHRGSTRKLFIPKGQWMLGGQLSWKQWDNDNLSYLLLQDINFSGHNFSAGPYLGYFFAKNLAVGCRFSYNRSYLDVGEIGLSLGEGLSFSVKDFYYLQHGYQSSVFLRSYIPIGESKIFGLFGELQLNHTFSEWKATMGRDDLLQGVYQNTHAIGIGLGGGLAVFLTDFAAAEVMLNVGGYDYKWGYQSIKEIDKKDEGHLNSSSADFKIDLFSIKFGLTFYL